MLPILMMAAQLMADKQKKEQEQKDLYQSTLDRGAARMGGGDYLLSDVYGAQRKINDQPVNYGAILSMLGRAGDDDELKKGVTPRSGVRLKMEDF